MDNSISGRREFLKYAAAAIVIPAFAGCRDSTLAQKREESLLDTLRRNAIQDPDCEWCGAREAPDKVGRRAVLAPETDPGEGLRIDGTVYRADGKTPAAHTLIYLYHTDIYGIYGRTGEHRHGRYRGWMLTDANGKYEFETIRPASYPNSTIAAHIHMTVTTGEAREDWIDSILFEGDRFITARERVARKGGFDPVLRLEDLGGGVFAGTRDIRLP